MLFMLTPIRADGPQARGAIIFLHAVSNYLRSASYRHSTSVRSYSIASNRMAYRVPISLTFRGGLDDQTKLIGRLLYPLILQHIAVPFDVSQAGASLSSEAGMAQGLQDRSEKRARVFIVWPTHASLWHVYDRRS